MKPTTYLSAILPALLLVACAATSSSLQNISDARSAVKAAERQIQRCEERKNTEKQSPCQRQTLDSAKSNIKQAEHLLKNGQSNAASQAALQALNIAQEILRQYHAQPD